MKRKETYIFNCNGKIMCVPLLTFNSIINVHEHRISFLFYQNDKDYVYGFSTNNLVLTSLKYDLWKAIVSDIQDILYKHNVENVGFNNIQRHIKISSPWEVEDSKKKILY